MNHLETETRSGKQGRMADYLKRDHGKLVDTITSAATALAAKAVTELWEDYPLSMPQGDEEAWPDHLAELAQAAKRPIGRADTE